MISVERSGPRFIDGPRARASFVVCAALFAALAGAHAYHARALSVFSRHPLDAVWAANETRAAYALYAGELGLSALALFALSRWSAAVQRFAVGGAPWFAHSARRAVFSWWIPFVHAVLPYWVLADAYEAMDPSALPEPAARPREDGAVGYRSPLVGPEGARVEVSRPPLRAFWACWLLSTVLARAAEAYGLRFEDPAHLASAAAVRSVAALVTAVALLLASRSAVAFDLAARERVRREDGLAP